MSVNMEAFTTKPIRLMATTDRQMTLSLYLLFDCKLIKPIRPTRSDCQL